MALFRPKVQFYRRMSATKFLCVTTVSGCVARHPLAYLFVHKKLVVEILSYLKFWPKLTHHCPSSKTPICDRFARNT